VTRRLGDRLQTFAPGAVGCSPPKAPAAARPAWTKPQAPAPRPEQVPATTGSLEVLGPAGNRTSPSSSSSYAGCPVSADEALVTSARAESRSRRWVSSSSTWRHPKKNQRLHSYFPLLLLPSGLTGPNLLLSWPGAAKGDLACGGESRPRSPRSVRSSGSSPGCGVEPEPPCANAASSSARRGSAGRGSPPHPACAPAHILASSPTHASEPCRSPFLQPRPPPARTKRSSGGPVAWGPALPRSARELLGRSPVRANSPTASLSAKCVHRRPTIRSTPLDMKPATLSNLAVSRPKKTRPPWRSICSPSGSTPPGCRRSARSVWRAPDLLRPILACCSAASSA